MRKYLFSKGFRYRKNDKRYPGQPDIVLPKYKTIIFVNGCFWHGHCGCKYFIIPKTNTEFWINKIHHNTAEPDKRQINQLKKDIEGKEVLRGTEKTKIECEKVFFDNLSQEGYVVHFKEPLNNKQMKQIIREVMREEE